MKMSEWKSADMSDEFPQMCAFLNVFLEYAGLMQIHAEFYMLRMFPK